MWAMHRMPLGILLTLALLAPSAPARAEQWTRTDPRGDVRVTTFDPLHSCARRTPAEAQHPSGEDLTALVVRHAKHRVVVTLRYAGHGGWDRTSLDVHLRTPSDRIKIQALQANPAAAFETTVGDESTWVREPVDDDGDGAPDCRVWTGYTELRWCVGIRTRTGDDRVTISVPRSCLGRPGWVRAGAETYGYEEGIVIADQWGTRHMDDDPRDIVYGRRVHVAR